jgi:D-threo-aldose 1-dehydrogenase
MVVKLTADQYRLFGNCGLRLPPIIFSTCALTNPQRVMPEQTKLNIIGEWFQHVAPPVFIDVGDDDASRQNGLLLLSRAFARFEIEPDEIVISLRLVVPQLNGEDSARGINVILQDWEESCQLLGRHAPKLVAIELPEGSVSSESAQADRDRYRQGALQAVVAIAELKTADHLAAVGVAARDWRLIESVVAEVQLDWAMFRRGYTLTTRPPEMFQFVTELDTRGVAVVNSGVYGGGFLVGGDQLHSRRLDAIDLNNEPLFKWRRAFTALCHGHGVAPAHACVQFALSAPGVASVALRTSNVDRVAEDVLYVQVKVPTSLWDSMKEEGLIEEECVTPSA